MSDEDNKVVDISLLRKKQRQEAEESTEDPIMQAAHIFTKDLSALAGTMPTPDIFTAFYLAEEAMLEMLIHALGDERARDVVAEGRAGLARYTIKMPEHYQGPTVFDEE